MDDDAFILWARRALVAASIAIILRVLTVVIQSGERAAINGALLFLIASFYVGFRVGLWRFNKTEN